MEPRQLHYFITIAELGSFAAASRALHITQPALTRQMQNLEEDLGAQLFTRHSRGVQLTHSGALFYDDARAIIQKIENAKNHLMRANRGELGGLKIAVTPQHLWLCEVQQHLSNFRKYYPDIALNLSTMHSRHQLMALRRAELDVGFLFMRPKEDSELDGKVIYRERILLAVHENSPFAHQPPESLHALEEEAFIWSPKKGSHHLYNRVTEALTDHNFFPTVQHQANNYDAMLTLVAAGCGYTFVPEIARSRNFQNIYFHELPELKITLDLELVWRKDNHNPCLPQMIRNYPLQFKRLR